MRWPWQKIWEPPIVAIPIQRGGEVVRVWQGKRGAVMELDYDEWPMLAGMYVVRKGRWHR